MFLGIFHYIQQNMIAIEIPKNALTSTKEENTQWKLYENIIRLMININDFLAPFYCFLQ